MRLFLLVLLCSVLLCGCELLGVLTEVARDPTVQAAASGVIGNVVSGNWIGALVNLVEFGVVGVGAWKATNISRDRKRKGRGEAV